MNTEKIEFIKTRFIQLLNSLEANQKGNWGVMNAQQMVEHMTDYLKIASGKVPHQVVLTAEQSEKARTFMLSERLFRENTPNQLLPDVPPPCRFLSISDSISELKNEIDYFFDVFSTHEKLAITNPFFGDLNFDEQIHLLHKHATHHARQFGLI